jgi:hypothetical protein
MQQIVMARRPHPQQSQRQVVGHLGLHRRREGPDLSLPLLLGGKTCIFSHRITVGEDAADRGIREWVKQASGYSLPHTQI